MTLCLSKMQDLVRRYSTPFKMASEADNKIANQIYRDMFPGKKKPKPGIRNALTVISNEDDPESQKKDIIEKFVEWEKGIESDER